MSENDYSWVHEGGDAILVSGHQSYAKRLLIIKVGKRDVTLDDGTKFNINHKGSEGRLVKRGAGAWDPSTDLYPPDSPRALAILREQDLQEYLRRAEALVLNARRESSRNKRTRQRDITNAIAQLKTAQDLLEDPS